MALRSIRRPSVRRRVAAAIALATFALAIVVVVVLFLQRPILLPVIVIALLITVVSGWVALVSRGGRRLAFTAVALTVFVALLVFLGVETLVGAGVLLVLMAVANLAARVAFGYERAVVQAEPYGTPVRAARRGVLLMNPRSGGAKVAKFHLTDEARRRGIEPVVLEPGDDLRALAERAVADGADVIGMAGGDGSQAVVADVARTHDLPFVCVPAGTRNHFALDLGLDRNDVAAALDAFGDAVERRVDLATVAGRVFVNNASLGLYATIVQSEAYRDAKLSTAVEMMPDLVGPHAPGFDLHYDGPDGERHDTADVLLVSNNPYAVRTLAGAGSRPRLDSGVLGLVAVRVDQPRDVPALAALEAAGAVNRFSGLREWTAEAFRVDSSEPVPVGLDGEALRMQPPLEFRILPGALRVRLPVAAPGAGQTVVLGVRGALAALWRILVDGVRSPARNPPTS